jgi:hypothetical protein
VSMVPNYENTSQSLFYLGNGTDLSSTTTGSDVRAGIFISVCCGPVKPNSNLIYKVVPVETNVPKDGEAVVIYQGGVTTKGLDTLVSDVGSGTVEFTADASWLSSNNNWNGKFNSRVQGRINGVSTVGVISGSFVLANNEYEMTRLR